MPSESVFSRAFAEFAATQVAQRTHEALIRETHHDRLVGHLSRDSTAIEAREKPVTTDKAPPAAQAQAGTAEEGRGTTEGDGQIPVGCILTSASLHDSQAAIPLATMSAERVTNFYDLMDAAYDAEPIREHSRLVFVRPLRQRGCRPGDRGQPPTDGTSPTADGECVLTHPAPPQSGRITRTT